MREANGSLVNDNYIEAEFWILAVGLAHDVGECLYVLAVEHLASDRPFY
jgi:hypothetical protein